MPTTFESAKKLHSTSWDSAARKRHDDHRTPPNRQPLNEVTVNQQTASDNNAAATVSYPALPGVARESEEVAAAASISRKRRSFAYEPRFRPSKISNAAAGAVTGGDTHGNAGENDGDPAGSGSGSGIGGAYTQRRGAVPSTLGVSQDPLLSPAHPRYGLPARLVANLAAMGIAAMYPWQSACLLGRGVLSAPCHNLVYAAPTGGGKSLVADILMLRRVLKGAGEDHGDGNGGNRELGHRRGGRGRGSRAIVVLPYVALVQEKLRWLRRALEGVEREKDGEDDDEEDGSPQGDAQKMRKSHSDWNEHRAIRTVGFFMTSQARGTWDDADIAVCTIEKANALINAAIDSGNLDDLGTVVLDELHMIDDEHRGYQLELMASKLLSLEQRVQIIGMSATLSNIEVLAKWLKAKYYQTKYKPIPIEEFLVYDNKIYPAPVSDSMSCLSSQVLDLKTDSSAAVMPCRLIDPSKQLSPRCNAMVSLAIETVSKGYGALVFCSSRAACQVNASMISDAMPQASDHIMDQRIEVLSNLRSLMLVPLDPVLEQTVIRGVAFHHAGLTTEERDIVAEAFDRGILKVIVATCSLAAGVNLPARRVILHSARMGRDLVGPALLRQMRGRAGRRGKDEQGETYVCCEKSDIQEVEGLIKAELPLLTSSLTPCKRGFDRALLEVIAVRIATQEDAIRAYVEKTLLYHTMNPRDLEDLVQGTLRKLIDQELLIRNGTGCYEATPLGSATVAASLTPEDGLFLYSELRNAARAFVMDGEMHFFYLCAPVRRDFDSTNDWAELDWRVFRDEIERLDESGLRVMQLCKINPALVNRMANGAVASAVFAERSPADAVAALVYRRFYTALQLRDLCDEVPVPVVAQRFNVSRGSVQNLWTTCRDFAASTVRFCERLGWGMLAAALAHAADRLRAGARDDLLELARLPFVKSRTARVLWEQGMKSLRAIAEAEREVLAQALLLAQPKRKKVNGQEEDRYLAKMRERAVIVTEAASRLWERDQAAAAEVEVDL